MPNTRHPKLVTRDYYPRLRVAKDSRVMTHFEFRIPQSEFRNSQVSFTQNPGMSVLRPANGGSTFAYFCVQGKNIGTVLEKKQLIGKVFDYIQRI